MMDRSILKLDHLSRVKDLLDKYKYNVEDYVENRFQKLCILDERGRPRVTVSLTFQFCWEKS